MEPWEALDLPSAFTFGRGRSPVEFDLAERVGTLQSLLVSAGMRGKLLGIDSQDKSQVAVARLAALRSRLPHALWEGASDIASVRLYRTLDVWGIETARPSEGIAFSPEDAYLVSSSGTTGASKRAIIAHSSLREVFRGVRDHVAPVIPKGALWTSFHAPEFGFSYFEILGACVAEGALGFIADSGEAAYETLAALPRRADRPIVMSLTPSELRMLTSKWAGAGAGAVIPDFIVLSGEPVARAGLRDFFALRGAADTRVINTYALMETGGQIAIGEVTSENLEAFEAGFAGEPSTDAPLRLLEPGVESELLIGEPLSAGRYCDADVVGNRFEVDGGQRWLRTGDRGALRDGGLWITGRTADQRKIGGRWVDLASAERDARSTALVVDVAAVPVGITDETSEDALGLLVVVSSRASAVIARSEIMAALEFKGTTRIAVASSIPRLPGGKRDAAAIRALIEADRAAPGETVIKFWRDLLGDGISPDTNVLTAGIDSLGLTHAARELSRRIGKELFAGFFVEFQTPSKQQAALQGPQHPVEPRVRRSVQRIRLRIEEHDE